MESESLQFDGDFPTKGVSVLSFNKDNLLRSICTVHYPVERIKKKLLYKYLFDYMNCDPLREDKISASTIVIEHEYISDSYLRDYKFYYVDCYDTPEKHTRRVHFFKSEFDKPSFENIIINPQENDAWWKQNYIGYIVIRPLSSAIFGACVLKPYDRNLELGRHRYYTSCVRQRFNVFGKEISDFKALPFLEQDGAIGACATSALWSAFYKTASLFKNQMPAPHEITQAAGISFSGNKIFPNSGLDVGQIVKAISHYGLSYETMKSPVGRSFRHEHIKRTIYAYAKMGIPVLLGYYLEGYRRNGYHLVCVSGYRLDTIPNVEINNKNQLLMKADYMKRIYTHNDQFGPYAKVDFAEWEKGSKDILVDGSEKTIRSKEYLKCFQRGEGEFSRAYPTTLIVPLDKIIRVSFDSVINSINALRYIINMVSAVAKSDFNYKIEELVWDVYIDFGVKFKETRLNNKSIPDNIRASIAFSALPKYVWVGSLEYRGTKLLDVIYDASNLPNSFCIKDVFVYDIAFATFFFGEADRIVDEFIKIGGEREESENDEKTDLQGKIKRMFNLIIKNNKEHLNNEIIDLRKSAEGVLTSRHKLFFNKKMAELNSNLN